MALVGRGVGLVQPYGRGGEGRLEHPHAVHGGGVAAFSAVAAGERRGLQRLGQIEPSRLANIVHANAGGRRARLFESLGDHHGDRLVVVVDLGPAEQPGGVVLALAELARLGRGDDRQDAGRRLGRDQVHPLDASLGDR